MLTRRQRRRFGILLTVTGFLSATIIVLLQGNSSRTNVSYEGNNVDFAGFNNVTGADRPIVLNIIHYIKFRKMTIDFEEYLSILSAHHTQNPEAIYIHTDVPKLEGYYFERLKQNVSELRVKHFLRPTHIFGQRLSSIYHSSDVARIQILLRYGGIFVDGDVILLKSLEPYRKFEMALGWPPGENIGTQVLIAHKNARFLKLWLDSYKLYKPRMWYYNAGQLPTERILHFAPYLVHRVKKNFGVHPLVKELYEETSWGGWRDLHAIHLLARHRSYLAKEDVKRSGIVNFDEFNIKWYDRAFGDIARHVLYGTTKLLDKAPWVSHNESSLVQ